MSSFLINSTKNDIDLFLLLAGQSNALGATDGQAPTRNELIGDIDDALIYNGTVYETLNYPNNNNGLLFACELSLAYNYTSKTGNRIYLEKVAVSGSALANEVGKDDWNVNSAELIEDSKAALERLKNLSISLNSKNPRFVMVWVQGPRDARINKGNEYQSNFNAFLAAHEQIQPLDLVVVSITTPEIFLEGGFTVGSVEEVNRAQLEICNSNILKFKYLDMRNYPLGPDNLHFTNIGQELIGDDVFNIIKSKFNI